MAAEARQLDAADVLERRRARLRELAGDATDLHDRHAERVGQHDGHLQDDAQLLADVDGRELLEALGAVAGLEQERIAGGDLGERRLERAGLAGEHQRRIAGDLLQRTIELTLIRPVGLLVGGVRLPRRWCPRLCHPRKANGSPCALRRTVSGAMRLAVGTMLSNRAHDPDSVRVTDGRRARCRDGRCDRSSGRTSDRAHRQRRDREREQRVAAVGGDAERALDVVVDDRAPRPVRRPTSIGSLAQLVRGANRTASPLPVADHDASRHPPPRRRRAVLRRSIVPVICRKPSRVLERVPAAVLGDVDAAALVAARGRARRSPLRGTGAVRSKSDEPRRR